MFWCAINLKRTYIDFYRCKDMFQFNTVNELTAVADLDGFEQISNMIYDTKMLRFHQIWPLPQGKENRRVQNYVCPGMSQDVLWAVSVGTGLSQASQTVCLCLSWASGALDGLSLSVWLSQAALVCLKVSWTE